jgi:hypothetical protein
VSTAQMHPNDPGLAHQPLHPLVVDRDAAGTQLHGDPRGPVAPAGVAVDDADALGELRVLGGRGGPPLVGSKPGMEP